MSQISLGFSGGWGLHPQGQLSNRDVIWIAEPGALPEPLQPDTLGNPSSSLQNLVLRPLGQGGKTFLELQRMWSNLGQDGRGCAREATVQPSIQRSKTEPGLIFKTQK